MKRSEIIDKIMFDYEDILPGELHLLMDKLPCKHLRWLAAHHPDNRTRKEFLLKTNVSIGEGTVINMNFIVSDNCEPLLTIGKRVAISPNVTIICASAPNNSELNNNNYVRENLICAKPVVIENDVWIGTGVIILPGVTVKEGSIIGAGAVVSSNVEKNSVYTGVPARFVKKI